MRAKELLDRLQEAEGMETRVYKVTGYPSVLDELEEIFGYMQNCGKLGTGGFIKIYVDGDGAARLRFSKDGAELPNTPIGDKDEKEFSLGA